MGIHPLAHFAEISCKKHKIPHIIQGLINFIIGDLFVKVAKKPGELEKMADEALKQIEDRQYTAELYEEITFHGREQSCHHSMIIAFLFIHGADCLKHNLIQLLFQRVWGNMGLHSVEKTAR